MSSSFRFGPARRTAVGSFIDNRLPSRPVSTRQQGVALTSFAEEARRKLNFNDATNDKQSKTLTVSSTSKEVATVSQEEDEDESTELDLDIIYKDAEAEAQQFQKALQRFEETCESSKFLEKYKKSMSWDKVTTWDDVLAEVEKSAEKYNNPKGPWGRIRKAFRVLGKNHEGLKAWFSIIPNQDGYFSILVGGLRMIIGAAGRLSDLRDELYLALEELPSLLECTNQAVGIFRQSKRLHQASADLYVSIVGALHHMIWWMEQNAISRAIKAFFKQDSLGVALLEKMDTIKACSSRFDDVARLCSYEVISRTNMAVNIHRLETKKNQTEIVQKLEEKSMEMTSLKKAMASGAEEINRNLNKLDAHLQTAWENVIMGLAEVLSSSDRINYRTRDVRGPLLPVKKRNPYTSAQNKLQLYGQIYATLQLDSSSTFRDAETLASTIWTLPRPAQDRAMAIMQDPRLKHWLTSPESATLFLNSNHNTVGRLQPSSFVSARLMASLSSEAMQGHGDGGIIPLAFFFSEHTRASDAEYGFYAATSSLIAQVLDAYSDFSPQLLKRVLQIHKADPDSLGGLLEIFRNLVMAIPATHAVFCILDYITHFESIKSLQGEAEFFAQTLAEIVDETRAQRRCVFKLLCMSPWNSRWMYKKVSLADEEAEVVWLPNRVPNVGGFTAVNWKMVVRGRLGDEDELE